jgi:hypothetical protein
MAAVAGTPASCHDARHDREFNPNKNKLVGHVAVVVLTQEETPSTSAALEKANIATGPRSSQSNKLLL